MPATIDYHPELKNVLVMTISGHVTMDEVLDITEQEGELIRSAGAVIHTIIDLRQSQGVPQNFVGSIPRITSMPAAKHPNAGDKLVVGAAGLAETFLNIFSKIGRKLFMFKTMEEALAHLNK